jgi:hypothetical protein
MHEMPSLFHFGHSISRPSSGVDRLGEAATISAVLFTCFIHFVPLTESCISLISGERDFEGNIDNSGISESSGSLRTLLVLLKIS